MAFGQRVVGSAVLFAIAAATLGLYRGGFLARLDNAVSDTRAALLAHETESEIVIVGIDAESLQTLSEWPWPRRHHARLLQHLRRAEPKRVFLDIDFSSYADPADDELLEKALAEWPGTPVLLAMHVRSLNGDNDQALTARPLERFARHADLASVMLQQSPDGLVRTVQSTWLMDGELVPSAFVYDTDLDPTTAVRIDYSILPSSFAYVPYSRLLNGEIDLAALRGKSVYIGSTAVELSDTVPVPVYGWLPGVLLQALAAETIRAGLVRSPPSWVYTGMLFIWTASFWTLFGRLGWRRNLMLLGGGALLLAVSTVFLYRPLRVDLDVTAFALSAVLLFVAWAVRSLDAQTWRAIALAIGLKRRDALLKSVVESTTDAIVCVDENGVIRTANPATYQLLGCAPDAFHARRLGDFVSDLDDGESMDALTGRLFECTAESTGGEPVPVEVSVSRVQLDEERLFTVILRDVSERRAQQEQLEHQANHDALTGLPNRTSLNRLLESVLEDATTSNQVALLLLDLSRFKEVNDTLGHEVGDNVLREVSERFSAAVGPLGVVGRIGGDEFTVVLKDVTDRAAIDGVARALIDSLTDPIHVRGIAIEVGVSIGIALVPDHARSPSELLRNADIAMYTAKSRGNQLEYFELDHDRHTVRRLSMMSELRSAIERDQIDVFYQPQVALQSEQSQSVEALLRWSHPMLGDVQPDEFISLAESTNLIKPLTEWTILQSIRQVQAWKNQGLDLRIAVNLSARLLQDSTFPQGLASTLDEADIDPSSIELEITESAMMLDPDRAMRIIRRLHNLGVLISIDDFGTGFSSLGYLRDLAAHALKLDKSFVIDLEFQESNRVIVESTVEMAHALGLEIVAEGVESDWVVEYLTRIGYDFAQGYRFAKPMRAQECFAWITRFNAEAQRRAG